MAKYKISTQIVSNAPVSELFYDLTVYRTDGENKKHTLLSVAQQPLYADYRTEGHETNDTDDDLSVIYLMEIMLYRRHGGKLIRALSVPSTKMYTLGEMVSGRAKSKNKRENVCYFETTARTKLVKEDGKDNIHSVKITCQERAFVAREYPVGDPDDPFEKGKIENQIASRLSRGSYPNQGQTSLCGPACFFYCLQMDRPDIYAQAARELWQYGRTKIGSLEISPGKGCRNPGGSFYDDYGDRISGLDWITMASLRDAENSIFSYDEIDDQMAGITMWGKLSEWFEKAGYEKVFSNVGIAHVGINGLCDLNKYADGSHKIVTLISAGILVGYDSLIPLKNHWITWSGKVGDLNGNDIALNTDANEFIELKLFSWGKVKNQIKPMLSLEKTMRSIFGGVVFKPLK